MHVADDLVLALDALLDAREVVGDLAVLALLGPGLLIDELLGGGEDVLDGVGNDEVLVGLEAVDGGLVLLGDGGAHLVGVLEGLD